MYVMPQMYTMPRIHGAAQRQMCGAAQLHGRFKYMGCQKTKIW